MFRYLTAGESHGPQLSAIIEGLPAGIRLSAETVNLDLARRQQGYGRGGRMKIEKDTADLLSGVRWGETLGSPLTLVVKNRDWENWLEKMSPLPEHRDDSSAVTRPRPGFAGVARGLFETWGHLGPWILLGLFATVFIEPFMTTEATAWVRSIAISGAATSRAMAAVGGTPFTIRER